VLTRNPYGSDSQPTWSPDGTRIAFVRTQSQALWSKRALFVRRVAGREALRISDAVAPDHPAWSPRGGKIVIDGLGEHHRGLRLVDLATGAVTDLTHPQYGFDRSAAWSPDGRELAFVRGYGGSGREIRVMTLASGEERGMPDWPDPVTPYGVTWSPDGTRIAAAGFGSPGIGGPPAIWTFKPDGSDRRFLRHGYSFGAPTAITWQPR
jgi:Tol biopolymer transport system component